MKRLSSIVVVFLLFLNTASADNLPRVTGLNLEGDLLTWDAQWGAVGYNIYLDFEYFDTVGDVQEYTVTEPGKYHVISFNGSGDFGVLRNEGETGPAFLAEYTGVAENVSYTFRYPVLIVQHTCQDVGPGESCIARCPDVHEVNYGEFTSTYYPWYLSGGACSTSDIVEADAFVSPRTYSCTVPTFSGEVVAQGVCIVD